MNKELNNKIINIKLDVSGVKINDYYYLSLKDLTRSINEQKYFKLIKLWLNDKKVLEKNMIWEINNNNYFDSLKICKLRDTNSKLHITIKQWIKEFNGKGFIFIDDEIYAVKDLLCDFVSWLATTHLEDMIGDNHE